MNHSQEEDQSSEEITTANGTPIEDIVLEHFGHKPVRHILITKNGELNRRLIRRRTKQ